MTHRPIAPERYVIRQVSPIEELHEAFAVMGAQFTPPSFAKIDASTPWCDATRRSALMLILERHGRIIGGALPFGSTLRLLALEPSARGKGLGRRLLQTFEVAALRLGVCTISLAADDAKEFYVRIGYHGKSSLHKELPAPGRAQALRLKRLELLTGNLEVCQVVQTDSTGKVQPLF